MEQKGAQVALRETACARSVIQTQRTRLLVKPFVGGPLRVIVRGELASSSQRCEEVKLERDRVASAS